MSARSIVWIVKKITMNNRIKSNVVRIIAGQWRGTKLPVADSKGLRPTTDRVRETVFNWLTADISNAHVLDLFAGTGVLGLECISRGAKSVQFIEADKKVASILKSNIERLQAGEQCYVVNQTALQFLHQAFNKKTSSKTKQAADIVFIDPPFDSDLLRPTIETLNNNGWLNDDAMVYIEQSSKAVIPEVPESWQLYRQGKAGQSAYFLYRSS